VIDKLFHIVIALSLLITVSLVAFLFSKEPLLPGQPDLSWFHYITGVGLIVLSIILIGALIFLAVVAPVFFVTAATLIIFSLATNLFIGVKKELTTDKRTSTLRCLLRLFLTEEDEENIVGDLFEEFAEIAVKHGEWYAKLWYYKQVAASAWPMLRKATGWGLVASIGAWIRRLI
jgi:hypothetical protein